MKLIAIDLDGTLLSSDCTISKANVEAIRQVQKQGDIAAIASGRSLHDTKHILHSAGLECPVITGNGAVSFHSEQLIQHLALPPSVAVEMAGILDAEEFYYEIYTNKGIYIRNAGKEQLKKEVEALPKAELVFPEQQIEREIDLQYGQHGLILVDDYTDMDFAQLEPYKLFVLSFNREKLMRLKEILSGRADISLTTSGRAKLEIGHPDTSKGNALLFLANHLGIPAEETVAIGDNLNDLSMFRAAGKSIAMENAEEEVKKASTYITKHHNEDGVAFALQKYVLITV